MDMVECEHRIFYSFRHRFLLCTLSIFYNHEVGVQRKDIRDTVPSCERGLKIRPQCCKVAERRVEVVCIKKETDEEAERELAVDDKENAVREDDQLAKVRCETVDRRERIVRDAGADGC